MGQIRSTNTITLLAVTAPTRENQLIYDLGLAQPGHCDSETGVPELLISPVPVDLQSATTYINSTTSFYHFYRYLVLTECKTLADHCESRQRTPVFSRTGTQALVIWEPSKYFMILRNHHILESRILFYSSHPHQPSHSHSLHLHIPLITIFHVGRFPDQSHAHLILSFLSILSHTIQSVESYWRPLQPWSSAHIHTASFFLDNFTRNLVEDGIHRLYVRARRARDLGA